MSKWHPAGFGENDANCKPLRRDAGVLLRVTVG